MSCPVLYLVVPCYNEETVLPLTGKMFEEKLTALIASERISDNSRILFVNDGSSDNTWTLIRTYSEQSKYITGISLSRNRGHQNALLAGLMEAKERCDVTVSIDCDGQDDINAVDDMLDAYADGCEVVYGVRSNRDSDTFLKRFTAEGFYKFLRRMGAEVVFNHADYRLLSARALDALSGYKEVNLYLRGMVPLVGFKSTSVYYERNERIAGKSHYSFRKMLSLAFDGITSFTVKPIRLVTVLGFFIALFSGIGMLWSAISWCTGIANAKWVLLIALVCLLCGVQLICLGVIGEYIGKIYLETKGRPRYIVEEKTERDHQ